MNSREFPLDILNFLTPIAQVGALDEYTKEAVYRTLFSNEIISEIKPCEEFTPIDRRDVDASEIKWTKNTGYRVLQGKGTIEGHLLPICGGPIWQLRCQPSSAPCLCSSRSL